ncbi:putative ribonuclease H-like domain-containing protein [Tanacetum coccineum]
MTHPSPKRNMVPKAVLMRSGLVSLTTARLVNTAQPKTIVNSARPMKNVFNKAHSTVRRPINNKTTTKNSNFNKRVNTVSGKNVNTARPKAVVNAARPKAVLNAVKGNQVNVVKASACWVWKPKTKKNRHVSNTTVSHIQKGNMSYLTDFEEIDGGYVAFSGNPKGGKIIGRDHLGKFDGKADEGFFVGYSINSKAFRVFNSGTRRVKENLHVQFKNQSNGNAGTKTSDDAGKARMEKVPGKDYILLPLWPADPLLSQIPKNSPDDEFKPSGDDEKKDTEEPRTKEGGDSIIGNNTNNINAFSSTVNAAGIEVNAVGAKTSIELPDDPNMPELEEIVYSDDVENIELKQLSYSLPSADHLKTFVVYQMDSRAAFLWYNKVEKSHFGLHQAPRAWYETLSTYLLDNGFQRGKIDRLVYHIRRGQRCQDNKHTAMETQKPLLNDEDGEEVDVHFIGSILVSLIYLKGQPKLGIWYPKDSPFDLVAYTDSDYAGASLDRKSTTGGINLLLLGKVNAARHILLLLVAKMVNGEVQLQALMDGKKIIITKATVRRDLQLEDANGVDCLMVKNLDNAVKFLMYQRFVQVFLNNQLEGMATHNKIYITPSHTKKIFANIRRKGKDFSRRETPLFPTMMVQAQEEMGEGSTMPTDPHHTPIITQPSSYKAFTEENISKHFNDSLLSGEDSMKLEELMELCTNPQQRVID